MHKIRRHFLPSLLFVLFSLCPFCLKSQIINSGFENSEGWTTTGNFFFGENTNPYSGQSYAYTTTDQVGNPGNSLYGELQQCIQLPSNLTAATLKFKYSINTLETNGADILIVVLSKISNCDSTEDAEDAQSHVLTYDYPGSIFGNPISGEIDNEGIASYESFELNIDESLFGELMLLTFIVVTDEDEPTIFRIDDVEIIPQTGTLNAPQNLQANSYSHSAIHLNWSSVGIASSYNVYDCNDNFIQSTTDNFLTVNNLNAETEYCYYVKAVGGDGTESEASECKCATTLQESNLPPGIPPGIDADGVSPTAIRVSWDITPNATSYEVYSCSGTYIDNTSQSYYVHTGLPSSTYYEYKVQAVNDSGSSDYTTCAGASTQNENPNTMMSGTVRTPQFDNGNIVYTGLSDASVKLMIGNEIIDQTTSTSGGYFSLLAPSSTTYDIEISKTQNIGGESVNFKIRYDNVLAGSDLGNFKHHHNIIKQVNFLAGITQEINLTVLKDPNNDFLTRTNYDTSEVFEFLKSKSIILNQSLDAEIENLARLHIDLEFARVISGQVGLLTSEVATVQKDIVGAMTANLQTLKLLKNPNLLANAGFNENKIANIIAELARIQVLIEGISTSVQNLVIQNIPSPEGETIRAGIDIAAEYAINFLDGNITAPFGEVLIQELYPPWVSNRYKKLYSEKTQPTYNNAARLAQLSTPVTNLNAIHQEIHEVTWDLHEQIGDKFESVDTQRRAVNFSENINEFLGYAQDLSPLIPDISKQQIRQIKNRLGRITILIEGLQFAGFAHTWWRSARQIKSTRETYFHVVNQSFVLIAPEDETTQSYTQNIEKNNGNSSENLVELNDAITSYNTKIQEILDDVYFGQIELGLNKLPELKELEQDVDKLMYSNSYEITGRLNNAINEIPDFDSLYFRNLFPYLVTPTTRRIELYSNAIMLHHNIIEQQDIDEFLYSANELINANNTLVVKLQEFQSIVADIYHPAHLVVDERDVPKYMLYGDSYLGSLNIKNYGDNTAYDVVAIFETFGNFELSLDTFYIGNIPSGSNFKLPINITAPTDENLGGFEMILKSTNAINDGIGEAIIVTDSIPVEDVVLSVEEENNDTFTFNVYPNPTDKSVNIDFNKVYINHNLQLLDSSGKILFEYKSPPKNTTLDTSKYPTGLYFLQLINNEGQLLKTQNLIIK